MRRKILVGLAALVLLALGVAAGYALALVRHPGRLVTIKLNNPGDPGVRPEHWQFPEAQRVKWTEGGNIATLGQALPGPAGGLFVTPASFDDVLKFYSERFGPDGTRVDFQGAGTNIDFAAVHCLHVDDSNKPEGKGARTVRLQTFSRKTVDYRVVVVVSRAEGDAHTHIVLVHQ